MTESSGVFTFPATGVWYIKFVTTGYDSADSSANNQYIAGTDDDFSTKSTLTRSYSYIEGGNSNDPAGNAHFNQSCECIFDVTSTSDCKVKFVVGTYAGATVLWIGSSTSQTTGVTFIRLGDT